MESNNILVGRKCKSQLVFLCAFLFTLCCFITIGSVLSDTSHSRLDNSLAFIYHKRQVQLYLVFTSSKLVISYIQIFFPFNLNEAYGCRSRQVSLYLRSMYTILCGYLGPVRLTLQYSEETRTLPVPAGLLAAVD